MLEKPSLKATPLLSLFLLVLMIQRVNFEAVTPTLLTPKPSSVFIVRVSNCIWWETWWTMQGRPDIANQHGIGNGSDVSRDLIAFENLTFVYWSNGSVTIERPHFNPF
jgi:hypothetical protein